MKYSFSEADQEKSLTVVQIGEKGSVQLHTIPLKPFVICEKYGDLIWK